MCFRVRMNYGSGGEDYAYKIWPEGYVGVWQGQWTPEDLEKACDFCRPTKGYVTGGGLAQALNALIGSRGGPSDIGVQGASAVLRFDDMESGTYVFTVFDRTIHMAQIAEGELRVLPQFKHNEEPFKARPIINQKSFRLSELPPSFLLLPSAGRGSVYKVPSCSILLKLLVDHETASQVTTAFDRLPWDRWFTALGPKGWESLSLGYLIQEYGFLPTGLSVGGTLKDFDIVGRRRSGELVYAQCKGDQKPHYITVEESEAFESLPDGNKFFFARCGVNRKIPGVTHIDEARMVEWLSHSEAGLEYFRLLRSAADHINS